jgi:hypothetical protein
LELLELRPLLDADKPLVTPTYDGSGQATEPSVLVFQAAWHGFTHWMVIGPYPNSHARKENPSILVSNDGLNWIVPPGLTNPIASPSIGHLSDSELFYDANTDQLWVYFAWELPSTFSRVMRMTSSDGVNWNFPQTLFEAPNYHWVSPTVQKAANTYYMWTVDAGPGGCSTTSSRLEYRTSQDGVFWSHSQIADLTQPGYVLWHIEVRWVATKQEFWLLLAAFKSNCGDTVLFFANSADGIHWTTYDKAALGTAPTGWDDGAIYRSGVAYDPTTDMLRVWYSARSGLAWHIGYTQAVFAQFLNKRQE